MRASGGFRRLDVFSRHFVSVVLALAVPLSAFAATTEVGALPGSFAVTPSGGATYSIPISMPPGINGLAPHLALTYSSQSGNGLAGYGWTLSGLSVITVCPKTLAQDGVSQAANLVSPGTDYSSNTFCIDGTKLAWGTGHYGGDGATYRKEIDDFSRFTSHTSGGSGPVPTHGPQYFTMQTADGLTYEYGSTADSEIIASGPGISSGVTARAWALTRVYDKFGNKMRFTYQQNTDNGDFWPIEISYTSNSTFGPGFQNTITFSYSDLNSISPALVWNSYNAGALVGQTQRLNEIDVNHNSVTIFKYTLTYDNTLLDANSHQGTERSLLHTVKECAGTSCYPVTTITWQAGTSGWGSVQPPTPVSGLSSDQAAQFMMLDVNGDGLPDIVYPGSTACPSGGTWQVAINQGAGSFHAPASTGAASDCNSKYAMPIDLEESGKQGLVIVHKNTDGTYNWYTLTPVIHGDGSVTFSSADTGWAAVGYQGNATVFDYNGDGLPDIVYSDGANVLWHKNKGDGTFWSAQTAMSGAFSSSSDDVIQFQSRWGGSTAFLDGTGTGGFMTVAETNQAPTWVIQQAGDTTDSSGNYVTSPPSVFGSIIGDKGNLVVPMFLDFNGDGLSDVLYANTATSLWKVFYSTGANVAGGQTNIFWDPHVMRDSLPVDYTGSGRQSVLIPLDDDSGNCTGLGLTGVIGGVFKSDAPLGTTSNIGACTAAYVSNSIRTADIDGDGLQDLLWVSSGTVHYAFHLGAYPDLVKSISNGFSQTYTVNYAALSKGAPYTPGSSPSGTLTLGNTGFRSSPPVERSYTGPIYVVTSYHFNDAVGGDAHDDFTYAGALINLVGRGFEGFSQTTASDSRKHGSTDTAGTLVQTTYNQSFPLTGTAASITSWTNSSVPNQGNLRSAEQNSYAQVPTQGNGLYVYLSTSTSTSYDLGTHLPLVTVTTTTTPNIPSGGVMRSLDVARSTSPVSVTSDTLTKFNTDTTNWCLALPSSVTVTNTDDTTQVRLARSVTYANDTANCRETSETVTEADTGDTLTTQYTYVDGAGNDYGHVITKTVTGVTGGNSVSRTTTYGYDSTQEFVTSITNALGEQATQVWDPALSVVLSATDPNNAQTTFTYDSFGLRTQETDADGTHVAWCYGLNAGDCGQATAPAGAAYWVVPTHYSATNQPGATSLTTFDHFGKPLQSAGNLLGGVQTNVQVAYDNLGRVTAKSTPFTGSSPSTWTYTTYDSFDRPVAVYAPDQLTPVCSASHKGEAVCQTSYAYAGFTTTVTDPKGHQTSTTADALGRTLSTTDANSGVTQYAYDPFGDLLQTADAAGNVTTLGYDTWGRKTDMTDPNMGHWQYAYDAFGELVSQTDAKSQTITMAYDALGRLTSKTLPGKPADTWTYDGPGGVPTQPYIGKLYSVQSGDGSYGRAYQYDSIGRPQEVDATIQGTTYTTNTSYDNFGRIASVTYPGEPTPVADDTPAAVASISTSPNPPVVGQSITLDGSQSNDPDNGPQPLSYTWTGNTSPPDAQPITGLPYTGTNPNFSFSTNTAGTYSFTLTVSDSVLTNSAVTSVTVNPLPIAGLQASAVSPSTGNVTLSWNPQTGDGAYYIEQSTNGGPFATLGSPPTAYSEPTTITGLTDGTYQFAVQTCSNGACDDWSAPVTVQAVRTPGTPAKPGLNTPNPNYAGQAQITWSKPSGTVTYYKVYTKVDSGAYNGGLNVGSVGVKTMTGLTSPHNYTFAVAACNTTASGAEDCGAKSPGITVKVDAPGVPWAPNLSGPRTVALNGTASFSWTNSGGTVTSWTLQRTDTNNGQVTTPYTGGATSFSQVLSRATTFSYQVKACNSSGCSDWSNEVIVIVGNGGNLQIQGPIQSSAPSSGSGGVSALVLPVAPAAALSAPQLLAIAEPRPNIDARVQAERDLGLRRWQEEVARAQYKRTHELADRKFDPRQQARTLYAAQVVQAGAAGPQAFQSVQAAVASGAVNAAALAPRRLRADTGSHFSVSYVYDANENLTEVVNTANPGIIYWQGTASDAFGHITTEILGNGVVTGHVYDDNTGALLSEASGASQQPGVADRVYTWDANGNLNTRQDNLHNLTETFSYDNLNRMTGAVVSGASSSTLGMSYDAVGNIVSKVDPGTGADMGTYAYDPSHPMEISSITPASGPARTFQYDNSNGAAGNGNLVNDGLRTYTWDAENRPTEITNTGTGVSTTFAYTPDGLRFAESTDGADPSSLIEVNGLFQVYTEGGHTSYRNSIAAPTGVVAIYTVRDDSEVTTRYLTTDHLGSNSEITNEVGTVTEAMSYDAFGAKRDPATWQTYGFGSVPNSTGTTDQGYTGQQQLDALGLIHMNGRVQDPYTGRFVSADPTVPDPMYSQSFNRFAYVYNNPMNAVDPSGFDQEFDANGRPVGDWRIVGVIGDGQFQDPFHTASNTMEITSSYNNPQLSSTPTFTSTPGTAGAIPGPTLNPITSPITQSFAIPGHFKIGGKEYDSNGNATDGSGKSCDCAVPAAPTQYGNFGNGSLADTCGDCDISYGNLSGFSAAGTGSSFRPPNIGPVPQAGNAGPGGPSVGINRNGPGSVGNTHGFVPHIDENGCIATGGPALCFMPGAGIEEGVGALARPTLAAIRGAYLNGVADLDAAAASMRAAGVSAKDALRIVAPLRNALKMDLREQGSWWAARIADIRNVFKYGNRAGPTADQLMQQYGSAENALDALGRTNPAVNQWLGMGGGQ